MSGMRRRFNEVFGVWDCRAEGGIILTVELVVE